MAAGSAIEWTESTWNPVTGCTKLSPGCKHCYAERMAERLQLMGQANYRNGFVLTLQPHALELPLRWKKPQRIFVNSMSDLFHDQIPLSYLKRVFQVMTDAHWHVFQVLTKRSERLEETAQSLSWPPNVWMGVTIENRRFVHRADYLRGVSAVGRLISAEPLLGQQAHQGDVGERLRPVHHEGIRRCCSVRARLGADRRFAVDDERRPELIRECVRGEPAEGQLAAADPRAVGKEL